MPKITIAKLEKWMAAGEKLMQSPITASVFAAIAPFLPKAGFTPTQIAGMEARAADAKLREARARERAARVRPS